MMLLERIQKLKNEIQILKKFPQRIENSNGTAIKFVDGTMICTTLNPGNGHAEANKVWYDRWDYPVPFIDVPVVTGNVGGGVSKGYTVLLESHKEYCGIQILCINPSGAIEVPDRSCRCIAIGRWK